MFDEDNLLRLEELLRNDQRSQRFLCAATGVTNNVSITEIEAKGGRDVNTRVHASDCTNRQSVPPLSTRYLSRSARGQSIPMAYLFLGSVMSFAFSGEYAFAYFSFFNSRFLVISVLT